MFFLFLGEVQYLFRDIAAPHLVLDHVVLEIGYSQFIIRLSFSESVDKIRFGEIKYTVIEYIIYILLGSYMRRAACPYTVNTSSSYGALVIRLIRLPRSVGFAPSPIGKESPAGIEICFLSFSS